MKLELVTATKNSENPASAHQTPKSVNAPRQYARINTANARVCDVRPNEGNAPAYLAKIVSIRKPLEPHDCEIRGHVRKCIRGTLQGVVA